MSIAKDAFLQNSFPSFTFGSEEDSSPIGDGVKLTRMKSDITSKEEGLGKRGEEWTEVRSLEPKLFRYHNFLSKEECEYLINHANPYLRRSKIADRKTGQLVFSSGRTSFGASYWRGHDKVIRDIEKRIADYTSISVEYSEGLNVLRYEVGQRNGPHHDHIFDEFNSKNGRQTMATLLMYLSDVEEGGKTFLTEAKQNEMLERAKRGISVKPKMGDALFWWNFYADGTQDQSSSHEACPVIKGTMWSATKIICVGECKLLY